MPQITTTNSTHDTAVARAEGIRQAAVRAASNQATATAADIACYRTALASAIANNSSSGTTTFLTALRELGVGS
jgi:hypothetical protein